MHMPVPPRPLCSALELPSRRQILSSGSIFADSVVLSLQNVAQCISWAGVGGDGHTPPLSPGPWCPSQLVVERSSIYWCATIQTTMFPLSPSSENGTRAHACNMR